MECNPQDCGEVSFGGMSGKSCRIVLAWHFNIDLPSEISLSLFMTDLILDSEVRKSDRMGIIH